MRRPSFLSVLAFVVAALASCTQRIATEDGDLSPTRLKYRLDDRFEVFYCDPDYYPVGRDDEEERALERFPAIRSDVEKLGAILEHLGLQEGVELTDHQKLLVYREDKRLAAIVLEPSGAAYRFQLSAAEDENRVFRLGGTIDRSGRIAVRERTLTIGTCPICLSGDTWIATDVGEVRVSELDERDRVWSLDAAGEWTLAAVLRTVWVPTPPGHELVRLRLADGREVLASPGHPLANGRRIGDLAPGDPADSSIVVSVERVPAGEATYDLLPSGPTGAYRANGIALGSTLGPLTTGESD